jgi:hypothetical protein
VPLSHVALCGDHNSASVGSSFEPVGRTARRAARAQAAGHHPGRDEHRVAGRPGRHRLHRRTRQNIGFGAVCGGLATTFIAALAALIHPCRCSSATTSTADHQRPYRSNLLRSQASMESVHPAAIRAANSRAEPHGCPVQRWEPTAAQPNQSTALANSTVRRTHRGRIGPPACRSSVMANHYPERPACVRDPRDCNPADTERVTTAPGDAFTTGEVRQYPTQEASAPISTSPPTTAPPAGLCGDPT